MFLKTFTKLKTFMKNLCPCKHHEKSFILPASIIYDFAICDDRFYITKVSYPKIHGKIFIR